MEDYLARCADIRVDIEAFGALDGARRSRGLSEVHLEVRDEKRQQYFPALRHKREKGPFRGKQKALVGAPRERVALQESWQNEWQDIKCQGIMAKASPCNREDFENAVAAAKLVFIQGRRRSVDFCGRLAQAACRV